MKCDQVLDALATGGRLRRWRAARHASRCPGCAASTDESRRLVESLSDAPPPTEAHRAAWMRAAEEIVPTRPHAPSARRIARIAIAAAVLGLAATGFYIAARPQRLGTPIVVEAIDPAIGKRSALRALDGLEAKASALSRELDDLLLEVDLLDARRDVEALQLRFAGLSND